jgi:hypothetical protein
MFTAVTMIECFTMRACDCFLLKHSYLSLPLRQRNAVLDVVFILLGEILGNISVGKSNVMIRLDLN